MSMDATAESITRASHPNTRPLDCLNAVFILNADFNDFKNAMAKLYIYGKSHLVVQTVNDLVPNSHIDALNDVLANSKTRGSLMATTLIHSIRY